MTVVAFPKADPGQDAVLVCDGVASPALSYLAHFRLTQAPFGLTPDTDFFYASPPHQEALNTLLYALRNGEGFIRIVGAVGTGKTLLCRKLMAALPADCHTLYVPNPAIGPDGILLAVAEELGLESAPEDCPYRVHKAIQTRLIELARRGIRVALLIDEAQAMSRQCLEILRLLSNLETEKRKLLSIVLFGQPELDALLDSIPQFKTRISFHDGLRPLTRAELDAYLAHRLARAGQSVNPFTPHAVDALHRASGGVPRIANIIAHKALMLTYGRGLSQVGSREMRQAALDTLAACVPKRRFTTTWFGVSALVCMMAFAVVWYIGSLV